MHEHVLVGQVGNSGELETTWSYDPRQPWEVRLTNTNGSEVVFGRELLGQAFQDDGFPQGIGRVRLLAIAEDFYLSLVTKDSLYTVVYDRHEVLTFLDYTGTLVGEGEESMDFDYDSFFQR